MAARILEARDRLRSSALVASIALLLAVGCAGGAPHAAAPRPASYLGAPGGDATTIQTYASRGDFCRGGGRSAELARRGTEIRVLGRERFSCAAFDARHARLRGDLARYRAGGDGRDRYVAYRDVYSREAYAAYALTPVPIPDSIRASGYEAGLQSAIDSHGVKALAVACDVPKAQRYIAAARHSSRAKAYHAERDEAFSAMATVGTCRPRDRAARANGDAAFLFAKTELHLGMPAAARDDAELAAAMYLDCDARNGYGKRDADYCRSQREAARRMAR